MNMIIDVRLWVMLGLSLGACTVFAQDSDRMIEEELRPVNERYTEAVQKNDGAALEAITSEDFVYVNEKGVVLPRLAVIAAFKSGGIKYEKVTFKDEKIHANGDTVWITGKYTIKGEMAGQPFDCVCRVVRIFTKTSKGWLVSYAQITPIQGG